MHWTSSTCLGRASRKLLTTYTDEASARSGAAHALRRYGRAMTPYSCIRCGGWHLCPADRETPSETCRDCHDRSGRPKQRYVSRDAAERRADIVASERGVPLRVYPCPCGDGYHLTSSW